MITNKKIDLYNYAIILVSIFPILGLKKSSISIIIFSVFSVVIFFSERNYKEIKKKDLLNFFILSSYFIAYFISYFFVDNKTIMLKLLEQNLSFLVFPLFFIFNNKSIYSSTLKKSLKFFVISNVLLAILIWYRILEVGLTKILREDNYYNPIVRNIFSDISEMHLPYLGMLYVFSSLVLLNNVIKHERRKIFIILNVLAIIILLFSVFLFASRMALFIFLFIATIMILKEINLKKKIIFFVLSFILILPVYFIPTIKNRLNDLKITKLILPQKNQTSADVNFRYGIYNCTWYLLKENWMFGVGPQNVQKKLDECYSNYTYKNYDDFNKVTYNTHNQYFDVFLKYGILGLLLFFIFLFWGIKNKNPIYWFFLFLILFSMLTENIFNRQIGIVFFNFFNTLFFLSYLKSKKTQNEN